jgi:hypothetical protein
MVLCLCFVLGLGLVLKVTVLKLMAFRTSYDVSVEDSRTTVSTKEWDEFGKIDQLLCFLKFESAFSFRCLRFFVCWMSWMNESERTGQKHV